MPQRKLEFILQRRNTSGVSSGCFEPAIGFVGIGKTGSLFVQTTLELFAHEQLLPTRRGSPSARPCAVGAEMGWHHASALLWHRAFGSQAWSDAFTFSLVRDPWARLVSHWAFHLKSKHPLDAGFLSGQQRAEASADENRSITHFRAWIRHVSTAHPPDRPGAWRFTTAEGHGNEQARGFNASQLSWLVDEDGRLLVDRVYKLEELEAHWPELQERVCGLRALSYREALNHPTVKAMDHASKHAPFADYYDVHTSRLVTQYMAADILRFGYHPPILGPSQAALT